ncbi:MAG: hypothetical protein RDV48_03750 [Candidatus Eremiobacteraeota bacterium]|nr:hypothetical protein [Candidatus Eremiobacteraeota bacterium]
MRITRSLVFVLSLLLIALIPGEVFSFSAHRPKVPPVNLRTKEIVASPTPTLPGETVEAPPTESGGPGFQGGGGGSEPTPEPPGVITPTPSPSPLPEGPKKDYGPTFVFGFCGLLIVSVVLWYFTRHLNLRRLFR